MAWVSKFKKLSSAEDNINITDLTGRKFNEVIFHAIDNGNAIGGQLRFNANSNTVYADRQSINGGVDGTEPNRTFIGIANTNTAVTKFFIISVVAISGEEKLCIIHTMEQNTAGAGNAPNRNETVGKFVPSPDADITQSNLIDDQAGQFDTNSLGVHINTDN